MEHLIELMKQNTIASLVITLVLGTLIPRFITTVLNLIRKGEQKTTEDAVEAILKKKQVITQAEHSKCSGNNVADVLLQHRQAQQKDFNAFSETIGREIGELKTRVDELDDRIFEHVAKRGVV